MAKVMRQKKADKKTSANDFSIKLCDALSSGLKKAGISASIATEPVRTTKLYRVLVKSKQFKSLRPSERQDLVWRIMGQNFNPDEQLRVSMIMTLSPDEL